jgi:hypothetical protein
MYIYPLLSSFSSSSSNHKEGLCPSSGGINGLMMMMMIKVVYHFTKIQKLKKTVNVTYDTHFIVTLFHDGSSTYTVQLTRNS